MVDDESNCMHNDACSCDLVIGKRTTVNIDDDLYKQAVRLTQTGEKTALIREALIERETAKRLAKLGGS